MSLSSHLEYFEPLESFRGAQNSRTSMRMNRESSGTNQ